MADPFSIAAGVVGLIATAAQAAKLKVLLDSVQGPPPIVTTISQEIHLLCDLLRDLSTTIDTHPIFGDKQSPAPSQSLSTIKRLLKKCRQTLDAVWAEVKPLLPKHGPPEGKRRRLTLDWHNYMDRLVQLNQELVSCKADVSNAYPIANLLATNIGNTMIREGFMKLEARLAYRGVTVDVCAEAGTQLASTHNAVQQFVDTAELAVKRQRYLGTPSQAQEKPSDTALSRSLHVHKSMNQHKCQAEARQDMCHRRNAKPGMPDYRR